METVSDEMIEGPMASPSRPSVRFTAFEVPTTSSHANGRYSHPMFQLKACVATKGRLRCGSMAKGQSQPCVRSRLMAKAPASTRVWKRSLSLPGRPFEFFLAIFM